MGLAHPFLLNIYTVCIVFLLASFHQEALTFYCTETFCAERTSEYAFPCDPAPNCTKIGYRTFLDPDMCNCCEYCFDYLELNDNCTTMSPQKPTEMCGPHLKCEINDENGSCQKMTSGPEDQTDPEYCMAKLYTYELARESGQLGIAQQYPNCDAGGYHAPKQCLPGSLCYCSSSNGKRVFGESLPTENQDCACARDVDRLTSFGFTGRLPHCLPNGNYDELQCQIRTCYCRSHPEEKFAMHKMNESKCFDPSIHVFDPESPRYYMRHCELSLARLEVQVAEAAENGTIMIIADKPKCDPDGNYHRIQSSTNNLYCAAPNGAKIDDFEVEKFTESATKMNCFCARARLLLKDSTSGKPICCKNGNYRPWQCIGSTCYCVDDHGRQVGNGNDQVDEGDIEKLPCYNNAGDTGMGDAPCVDDPV